MPTTASLGYDMAAWSYQERKEPMPGALVAGGVPASSE